jgi:hypothetical protein
MLRFQHLIPHSLDADAFSRLPPLRPFAAETLGFIEALSGRLVRTPSFKAHPELIALGFWMRPANLAKLRDSFKKSTGNALFQPRGTAFHIAPSNVDSIFIYSWFLSMICGNKNIVRLSSRGSPQLDLLIGVLTEMLGDDNWRSVAQNTLLVRYEHDAEITTHFSDMCDVRVIWGGDATVSAIRRLPLPPTACEVAFASKFSLALVHAQSWNDATGSQQQDWLRKFFNDVYWFGQMACSSPRLVVWHGDRKSVESAQNGFWSGLSALVRERGTDFAPVDYVNKVVAGDLSALRVPTVVLRNGEQNDVARIEVDRKHLRKLINLDLHCGAGLFYETSIDALDDLLPVLERRIQTVAYAGYDDPAPLRDFVSTHILHGIDRIVPFGQALEFSSVWDGFDLLRVFLRQVTVS